MNNNYSIAVEFIQDLLRTNPRVNTIIYARSENSDIFKNTVYPMVHINPQPSPWSNEKVNQFTFEIGALNQRVQDNRIDESKLDGDTNVLDNHNTCYAILNDLLTQLSKDNGETIYLEEVSSIQPVFFSNFNGLDGWSCQITLKMANKTIVC